MRTDSRSRFISGLMHQGLKLIPIDLRFAFTNPGHGDLHEINATEVTESTENE
jgi:hypothetical protein